MAKAISGAEVVREYEGAYANQIIYRQQCDSCVYVLPRTIHVWISPNGTSPYGTYRRKSFTCPFCEYRQVVKLQGWRALTSRTSEAPG